jgi:N-glycosylase/DNA lyase
MSVITVPAPDFDLAKTLNSGQVFHWIAADGGFCGLIGDLPVRVQQFESTLHIALSKGHRQDAATSIRHYFALDHALGDICRSFPSDPVMNAAADYCRGLRIIRQPKWECLATFICSSMKQVAHIRQMSQALRRNFGEQRQIGNQLLHTFPDAAGLAERSESDLRACALGYRAKNLLATAGAIASGEVDLDRWSELPNDELQKNLCSLAGVGAKVANCVMLFAYERLTAFPIDVWIERVLREQYFAGKRKPTAATLKQFSTDYFGAHGGYAQQYLFHHARMTNKRRKAPRKANRRDELVSSH